MNGTSARTPDFRLMIVVDHGLVREGLLALFRTAEYLDVTAVGAREAVSMARCFAPDVALVDLALCDADAFETARALLALHPPPHVLFLDDAVDPSRIGEAVAAGACGYWTKLASFNQLLDGLRHVFRGESSYCPAAKWYLASTRQEAHSQPPPDTPALAGLTRQESEVLALLAKGLTVEQCAERLQLASSTVDEHKSQLIKKLKVDDEGDLARLAEREGLA